MRRLERNRAVVAVIDVQEKLLPVIHDGAGVEKNVERLIRGAQVLGVPVIVTEQYTKGLGATVAPLRTALEETIGYEPIEKMCFSSLGCGEFADRIRSSKRDQIILCGIEAHVCVHQTMLDLLDSGLSVWIVSDAVSSRTPENREIALRRAVQEGAKIASTEMVLFELTIASGTDEFKAISRLVK